MSKNKKKSLDFCPNIEFSKYLTKIQGTDVMHKDQHIFVGKSLSTKSTKAWLNAEKIISDRTNHVFILDAKSIKKDTKNVVKIQPFKQNYEDIKREFRVYKLLNNEYKEFPKLYCHFICSHDYINFNKKRKSKDSKELKVLTPFCKNIDKNDKDSLAHIAIIEYVKGKPLSELTEQEKSNITISQINSIFKKVIESLIKIWGKYGIIHNDLSSGENIMLDGKNIKIMDFGRSEIKDKTKNFLDFKIKTLGQLFSFLKSRYNTKFDISTFSNEFDDVQNLKELKNIIKNKKIKKKKSIFTYDPYNF